MVNLYHYFNSKKQNKTTIFNNNAIFSVKINKLTLHLSK
jgi:hypothetical protein